MFRYLVGSQARAAGINAYEANRAADLLFSAAGHPALRERLRGILRRWDSQALKDLLLQTYNDMLARHPLFSERRVERLAGSLGDRKFQGVLADVFETVRSEEQFAAYLRSVLIHSIAIRLKQAFVLHGRGGERQVLVHAKLPIQFGADAQGDFRKRIRIDQAQDSGWIRISHFGSNGLLSRRASIGRIAFFESEIPFS